MYYTAIKTCPLCGRSFEALPLPYPDDDPDEICPVCESEQAEAIADLMDLDMEDETEESKED